MSDLQIVDVHMHIYRSPEWGRHRKFSYQIVEYGEKDNVRFTDSDGSPDEAIKAIDDAGFHKVVVANMFVINQAKEFEKFQLSDGLSDAERNEAVEEIEASPAALLRRFNSWACDLAKANEKLIPFIGADPVAMPGEEGAKYLREMVENHGARGVKLHPVLQDFDMADQRMWPTYKMCQELGIPVLGHSGPASDGRSYAEPRAFAPVLAAFPDLKMVIAHVGGATWSQALEIANTYPNAFFDSCEIIEWLGGSNAPTSQELAVLIRDIGPDRVMMGSDFPWYDLNGSVDRIMDLPVLTQNEKEAMLGSNAMRILGL